VSSSNGNTIDKDNYPTPIGTVEALLNELTLRSSDTFLEPCRGTGNIYDRINLPEGKKSWAELNEGVDYLTTKFDKHDVIITNPPFSLTVEFLKKSLSELAPDGTLVYLQRVNFLGSIRRLEFWKEIGFPNKTPIIVPRPRFVNGGSDSCEYMWMIWDRGERFSDIPKGLSHLISVK
jgi:hypothetical protein